MFRRIFRGIRFGIIVLTRCNHRKKHQQWENQTPNGICADQELNKYKETSSMNLESIFECSAGTILREWIVFEWTESKKEATKRTQLENYWKEPNWNDWMMMNTNENIASNEQTDRNEIDKVDGWKLPGVNWVYEQIIDGLLVNKQREKCEWLSLTCAQMFCCVIVRFDKRWCVQVSVFLHTEVRRV